MPPKKVKLIKVKLAQLDNDNPSQDLEKGGDILICHPDLSITARYPDEKLAREVAKARHLSDYKEVTVERLLEEYQDVMTELFESLIAFCNIWMECKSDKKQEWARRSIAEVGEVLMALENRFQICGLTVKSFDYLYRAQLEIDRVSENFDRRKMTAHNGIEKNYKVLRKEFNYTIMAFGNILEDEKDSAFATTEAFKAWANEAQEYINTAEEIQADFGDQLLDDDDFDSLKRNTFLYATKLIAYFETKDHLRKFYAAGWR